MVLTDDRATGCRACQRPDRRIALTVRPTLLRHSQEAPVLASIAAMMPPPWPYILFRGFGAISYKFFAFFHSHTDHTISVIFIIYCPPVEPDFRHSVFP